MNQDADATEVCALLSAQKKLLWHIHQTATTPSRELTAKGDLVNFLSSHALHIHEMAKAALILMHSREPYGVVLLARSALESSFNMVAAMEDPQFGPQRIALEYEELAKKLKFLLEQGAWVKSRRPTPEDCIREADRIRRDYSAPRPAQRGEQRRIEKIEEIARTAKLSPFYDDDYRQLSLAVHSNQAGILNAASGFLVKKGMLSICSAVYLASQVLGGVFRVKEFDDQLEDLYLRIERVAKTSDCLPMSPSLSNPIESAPDTPSDS